MSFTRIGLLVIGLGLTGCVGAIGDGAGDAVGDDAEEIQGTFYRSDQVSFGRAPNNTEELHQLIAEDFSNHAQAAKEVIAWIDAHPKYPHPIYLGGIHAWLYDTDAGYRARIGEYAAAIQAHKRHPIFFYFEEENASHAPHPVSTKHEHQLRQLAKNASLLCATYLNGKDGHHDVLVTVARWKHWYHDVLGVPMSSLLIDVDLSQTPSDFYYGSRGNLTEFNRVVGWTLDAAYADGFAGFHTYGNVGGKYGTKRAADSTYAALNHTWEQLVKAHPKQAFSGI